MSIRFFSTLYFLLLLSNGKGIAQEPNLQDSLLFYYSKSNFSKAIFFSKQLVEKNRAQLTGNDSALGASINDLAFLYNKSGRGDLAEPLFIESMTIRKNFFGDKHEQYANTLLNIAALYYAQSKFVIAEGYMKNAAAIFKDQLGELSSEYATSINNLANLYVTIGNYNLAEQLQLKALSIRRKVLKDSSVDIGGSLNNLAYYYNSIGNYEQAEPLYKEAAAIFKKLYGSRHQLYATATNNLANVYQKLKRYDDAETLYDSSLKIRVSIYGKESNEYALALNELGSLYRAKGEFAKAEERLTEALRIRKKILGENHIDYAISLKNLGGLYYLMGKYKEALPLFTTAYTINTFLFGRENLDVLNTGNNMANSYEALGNNDTAQQILTDNISTECRLLYSKLDFLSEKELLIYINGRSSSFSLPFSSLWHFSSPQLIAAGYNSRLLIKSIAIQNTTSLAAQMEQSKDSLLAILWKGYKSNKTLLNKILAQPIAKRTINTDSLQNISNQQEKELLRQSATFRNMKEKLNATWQDVRSHLQPTEAAVEFVRFSYLKRKLTDADTTYYAAMIVRLQDTVPVFVKLFEEEELKAALKSFAYTAPIQHATINQGNILAKTSIYNLLWKPLEPYLTKTTTIYFSPDGLLHQIAFAAIPYKTGLLCDKYKLVQLTSTRQVTIKEEKEPAPEYTVLFGGINYSRQHTDTSTKATPDPYQYVYQQSRSTDLDSFKYLPGTLKEITAIRKSMELKQKSVAVFTGANATEMAFKKIGTGPSPQVIHFATHGFTLPDDTGQKAGTNTFKISDNPLLRSGLVLAGGNQGWKGRSSPEEDDGILTALEISTVPLQHTQLAVLSACQSGTGELRGSEGVFGLQRAFKIAGVNYVMASLWTVPDKETAEYMNLFYSTWLSGKSLRQSFISTQQAMRKKYAPYYWAAFTLVQ